MGEIFPIIRLGSMYAAVVVALAVLAVSPVCCQHPLANTQAPDSTRHENNMAAHTDDQWYRGPGSDYGVSNDKLQPHVVATGYTPRVMTFWKVGHAVWSDQAHTYANLGDFVFGHKCAANPVGCRYTGNAHDGHDDGGFRYKIQTTQAQKTSSYIVTPTTRSQIVVLAEGSAAPPLSAGWDTTCAGYNKIAGTSHYTTFVEGGTTKGMAFCARRTAQTGEQVAIASSTGDRVEIFVTPDPIGDANGGGLPSVCGSCDSHSGCMDRCPENYAQAVLHRRRTAPFRL